MKYKLLCLFVLLSFSLSDLYADIELSSKQMRTSDGLPSNSVRCMFQDSKGFLWLGTKFNISIQIRYRKTKQNEKA